MIRRCRSRIPAIETAGKFYDFLEIYLNIVSFCGTSIAMQGRNNSIRTSTCRPLDHGIIDPLEALSRLRKVRFLSLGDFSSRLTLDINRQSNAMFDFLDSKQAGTEE
jgi:hypothetical protein